MQRTVAIVGRPNVGKSALFNRLARRQIALVYDRPGVTRDRIVTTCRWEDREFTLVDTGGIGLEDAEGFGEAIQHEVDIALATATDIVFVVDGREGLTPLDREVAQRLRKAHRPVWVLANKIDGDKQEGFDAEFSALGFSEIRPVSAAHGLGVETFVEDLIASWPAEDAQPDAKETGPGRPVRVAIVGRPNVGKSSLINALLQDTRAIVSHVPGTTRDAVDIPYRWKERDYLLVDTAGLRQERRIQDELERNMTGRTAHAINRADVCILVVDALDGVGMQEKKIAGLIQEAHCPCVVVVNKWDLVREQGDAGNKRQREYYETLQNDLYFMNYAPVVFLSAKTGERLKGLLDMVEMIDRNRRYRFQTGPLNRVLQKAQEKYAPPLVRGKRFKIYYGAQQTSESGRQVPTLLLFVNDPKTLTPAYQRYLELQVREAFDLRGCPLRLVLKPRVQTPAGGGRSKPKPPAAGPAKKRGPSPKKFRKRKR
jgi:GTP-binding protein